MSAGVWRASMANRYEAAIELLETALREWPEGLWGASIWRVQTSDRHAWPITAGVGAELGDHQRLQLHSAFWNVAAHTLSALDRYLGADRVDPDAPAPFNERGPSLHALPSRVFGREELLGYLDFCRRKAASVLGSLTDEQAEAIVGRRPFGDLLVHNLMHLNEHVAQLNLFLNQNTGWSDSRWRTDARWFEQCPDCDQ